MSKTFAILEYMKSLSLSQPLILMVIGIPGAGKSFFARQFSDTFNAPLVSFDYIRTALFAQPNFSTEEETTVQTIAAMQISELVKTHKTFMIDGGLSARATRFEVAALAKKHGYGTLIVWVQTDEPTSKTRATKRNSRRRGDAYNVSLTNQQFDTHSKRLTAPAVHESFVVISGKHTYATQAKIILKKLVVPRIESGSEQPQHATTETKSSHSHISRTPQRRNVIIN